jgi:hypothetical protein
MKKELEKLKGKEKLKATNESLSNDYNKDMNDY